MKKTIPFDLFGEKQELCFTILGIAELEKSMGKSIQQIVKTADAGVGFCLAALPIALKRLNPHMYLEKIEKYLEEGGTIDSLAVPLIHAIAASGVLGKETADTIMEIYYPELYPKTEEVTEEEKNV